MNFLQSILSKIGPELDFRSQCHYNKVLGLIKVSSREDSASQLYAKPDFMGENNTHSLKGLWGGNINLLVCVDILQIHKFAVCQYLSWLK